MIIKENIIVKAKALSYEYEFILKTKNLTAQLSSDGQTLNFKAADKNNEEIFSIPAPHMIDGKGEYSDEVYYDISECEKDCYEFKIIADREWIEAESRNFPITIDPTITMEDNFTIVSISLCCENYDMPPMEYSQIFGHNLQNKVCIYVVESWTVDEEHSC